jgi:hypothetical protein
MVGSKDTQGKQLEDVQIIVNFPKVVGNTNLTVNVGQLQFDDTTKVI